MRSAFLACIAAMLLMTTGGCATGARELDEQAYIITIGIDKGVSEKLRYTFQFPLFSEGQESGGGGGGGSPTSASSQDLSTITIDCPTLNAAEAMMSTLSSRSFNFSHATYLIIGEDFARESVAPFINAMSGEAQIRRIMYVIVVRGKASDFIDEFRPIAGSSVSKSQEMLMNNWKRSALYKSVTYKEFADRLKCTKCQSVATLAALNEFSNFRESGEQEKEFVSEGDFYAGELPRKNGNKYEFLGSAVFNGMKMVGELNGNETRAMMMLRGKFQETQMAIPDPRDPELRIGALVFQGKKPDIKINLEEERPKIHAKVFLEATLQNVQNVGTLDNGAIAQIEEAFEAFIKENLDKTVKKCQEMNSEVFDFGYKAARQFLTIQDWENYNWLYSFKNAEVTTEVDFIIRRTGTIVAIEPERKSEG